MTSSASVSPRPKKFLRYLLITLAAIIVIVALLIAFASNIAHHYATQILQDKLGRQVFIDKLDLGVLSLNAEIRGFRILEADGKEEAFAFDRLKVDLDSATFSKGGPVLNELTLEGPRVRLVNLEGGGNNWSDVVERLNAGADDKAPSEDSAMPSFSLTNIRLTNGQVRIEDRATKQAHEISDLTIDIPFLSNMNIAQSTQLQPSLSAKINGKPLTLTGTTRLSDGAQEAELNVTLQDFDLRPWLVHVPLGALQIDAGNLNTTLKVGFLQRKGSVPSVTLDGQVQLADIALREDRHTIASLKRIDVVFVDTRPLANRWNLSRLSLNNLALTLKGQQNPAVQIPTLAVQNADIRLNEQSVQLASIAVSNARVSTVRRKDGSFDLQTLGGASSADKTAKTEEGKPWQLAIDKVAVDNATIHVQDQSSGMSITADQSAFDATKLSTDQNAAAPFAASARINSIAKLGVKGTLTLNPPGASVNLDMSNTDLSKLQGPVLDVLGTLIAPGDASIAGRLKALAPDLLKDMPDKAKEATEVLKENIRGSATDRLQDLLKGK